MAFLRLFCKMKPPVFARETPVRIYGMFNRIMVLYMLYAMSLPLWSHHMSAWLPEIWQCAYLRWMGEVCPLCGVTRDVGAWLGVRAAPGGNPATPWIVAGFGVLLACRLLALFSFARFPATARGAWVAADLAIHAALIGWLVWSAAA